MNAIGLEKTTSTLSKVFRELMDGVFFMHSKKVAHLDLNLENLLVSEDNTLKICDFGQASQCDKTWKTSGFCGKVANRAPETLQEQILEFPLEEDYDCRAVDIYCCGVILYKMIVGFYPHKAKSSRDMPYVDDTEKWNKILNGKLDECIEGDLEIYSKKGKSTSTKAYCERLRNFPRDALDLVQLMMLPADQRITEKEIRSHPYFVGGAQSAETAQDLEPKLNTELMIFEYMRCDKNLAQLVGIKRKELQKIEEFTEGWREDNPGCSTENREKFVADFESNFHDRKGDNGNKTRKCGAFPGKTLWGSWSFTQVWNYSRK
eukprot:TRINITY_DN796_c0_g1_i4.p1 TRINITY_DN796_c0_g1~~TRINITY_DN796_c0_g1_i4.p1  ORF type:complete len:319 (-),score=81.80 TRINITY_DN796_c0_g1_i4:387-1343(-)